MSAISWHPEPRPRSLEVVHIPGGRSTNITMGRSKNVHGMGTIHKTGSDPIVARISIVILSGAIALRQMGLANEIIELAFGILLGSVAVAAALAFGLGGRDIAATQLFGWLGSRKK